MPRAAPRGARKRAQCGGLQRDRPAHAAAAALLASSSASAVFIAFIASDPHPPARPRFALRRIDPDRVARAADHSVDSSGLW